MESSKSLFYFGNMSSVCCILRELFCLLSSYIVKWKRTLIERFDREISMEVVRTRYSFQTNCDLLASREMMEREENSIPFMFSTIHRRPFWTRISVKSRIETEFCNPKCVLFKYEYKQQEMQDFLSFLLPFHWCSQLMYNYICHICSYLKLHTSNIILVVMCVIYD